MKPLGARVDAFTIACRVRLDPRFLGECKARAEVAREHGRAAVEWHLDEPDTPMGRSNARYLGGDDGQPARHAKGYGDLDLRRRQILMGEMGYSRQRGVWRITREPVFRLQILEFAPGGGDVHDCKACRGLGWFPGATYGSRRETCLACKGEGRREDPGWTVEIIWYAQELARIGLASVLEESRAMARLMGEVLEMRVRRIDLCADIEGWEISPDDVKRIAKRPRARWAVDDAGPQKEPKVPRCLRTGACKERCTCSDMQVYGSGATLRDRHITGIAIGRGGALMARIYDKRCELANDRIGQRRELEEGRWREAGWKGQASVTRAEFQIRGVALTELGIRDPEAVVTPIYKRESYVDARGKTKLRAVAVGEKILTVQNDVMPCAFCRREDWAVKTTSKGDVVFSRSEGAACKCERSMTIVDRLEAIWRTCLEWVRLVTPEVTANGKPIPVARLKDDPRWSLLRTVTFGHRAAPIRRYRPRACASAAQALGVALSQAGRDGDLTCHPEGKEHYGDDEAAEAALKEKVTMLFTQTAEKVTAWLVDRFGGVAGASVHFAVRTNASRARWLQAFDLRELETQTSTAPHMAAS